jgi:pyruvate dehydrogenase E2 component (dihydrolipoamide acetyltransferase)
MATDIFMPLMGLTMSEGTVVRWYKQVGDTVQKGDPVLEIETDKATMDIEAPESGLIGPILVKAGTIVPVGTILSHVLAVGEAAPGGAGGKEVLVEQGDKKQGSKGGGESGVLPATKEQQPATSNQQRIFVSPLARRVAHEHQLDLRAIEASGPGGRIVVADVQAFLAQRQPVVSEQPEVRSQKSEVRSEVVPLPTPQSPTTDEITPMSSVRRLIAERMVTSRQTTAHVTIALEAEATGLATWRAALKADGQAVSYNDLLVCIVAKALREHPAMMTQITSDGQLRTPKQIDIGLAVDTPRGLLVPVLRDLAGKGATQVAAESQALIERARTGKLKPDELSGGVFTISNLGMYDIEVFTPVINLPECAILGVGSIAERAVVRDGQVCARLTVALSLAFDHRIVDGAPAAAFLRRVKQLVEHPLRLVS